MMAAVRATHPSWLMSEHLLSRLNLEIAFIYPAVTPAANSVNQ